MNGRSGNLLRALGLFTPMVAGVFFGSLILTDGGQQLASLGWGMLQSAPALAAAVGIFVLVGMSFTYRRLRRSSATQWAGPERRRGRHRERLPG